MRWASRPPRGPSVTFGLPTDQAHSTPVSLAAVGVSGIAAARRGSLTATTRLGLHAAAVITGQSQRRPDANTTIANPAANNQLLAAPVHGLLLKRLKSARLYEPIAVAEIRRSTVFPAFRHFREATP